MPEAYWELEAELDTAAEELWGLFCVERGALGAEVLEEGGPRAVLRHYFATDPSQDVPAPAALQAEFRAAYPDVPPPLRLTVRPLAEQAWALSWREHFAPLRLGRRILVVPPWAREPAVAQPGDPARVRIVIEPGQAFGTGWHASTAVVLLALEEALSEAPPPRRVVDIGTGSGILTLAARLLGVAEAVAIDLDGVPLPEARHNAELSGLDAPPWLARGTPDCLRGAHPLVLANIVSEVLLQYRDALARLTAPGGCLILGGILEVEHAAVVEAFTSLRLRLEGIHRREEWVALRLRQI